MTEQNINLTAWLETCPLIAILRGIQSHEVEGILEVLFAAGIRIAEIPLNSPEPFKSIRIAADHFGDRMLIGAGTVTQAAWVQRVAKSGGKLIVMPHADAAIVRTAKHMGLIAVPGFSTATEAFAMLHAGADAIKLFPAEASGLALFKAMRAVLPPDTKVIPVGGVDTVSIAGWKSAGASGFGIGSALYRPGDSALDVARKAMALVEALGVSS
jgi:2-dehydro-3-deoxyphosphogalactonate aldolase